MYWYKQSILLVWAWSKITITLLEIAGSPNISLYCKMTVFSWRNSFLYEKSKGTIIYPKHIPGLGLFQGQFGASLFLRLNFSDFIITRRATMIMPIHPLKPDVHWKIIRTKINLQLKAAGLLNYVWSFRGH